MTVIQNEIETARAQTLPPAEEVGRRFCLWIIEIVFVNWQWSKRAGMQGLQ
jgi:hypothetical protein